MVQRRVNEFGDPVGGFPVAPPGLPFQEGADFMDTWDKKDMEYPGDTYHWLTPEILDLLNAIPGPHQRKKRQTVVVLAFARANQESWRALFRKAGERGLCSSKIWYAKWQYIPQVWAAYLGCLRACLEYLDVETASIEEHFLRLRRRNIARFTAQVPVALASVMANPTERAGDRIEAAVTLYRLAEPSTAVSSSSRTLVEVQGLDAIDQELRAELARLRLTPPAEQQSPAPDGQSPAGGGPESA